MYNDINADMKVYYFVSVKTVEEMAKLSHKQIDAFPYLVKQLTKTGNIKEFLDSSSLLNY